MAPGKRDYYEILGVDKDASAQEIKRAYRKRAVKFHPDRNKEPGAEDKFKEVSEAYAVLSDPEKKQRYDQYGHAGIDQQYSAEDIFRGADFGDIFRGMGGFGSIFEDLFGFGQARGRGGPVQGRDMQLATQITLEEAFTGKTANIDYMRLEHCSTCSGSGAAPGAKIETCTTCGGQGQVQREQRTPFGLMRQVTACPTCGGEGSSATQRCKPCNGSGHERKRTNVEVKIPAGIDNGQTLRVPGKGEVGERGGPPGNLYVEVHVRQHKRFHRDGPDLLTELPVSIPQAVLGTKAELDTLDGTVTVNVPAGTETGKKLRLRGKGMPYLNGSGRGDLHIRIRIVVPEKLSDRARELLEELAEELGEDVEGQKKGLFNFLKH